MSLPLFDTLLAVVRRKLSGRSFAAADREHIHHRLLDRGMTQWQALCVIGALCLTTGAAATAATIFRNDSVAWITALAVLVFVIRFRLFGHHEWTLSRALVVRLGARLFAHFRGAAPGDAAGNDRNDSHLPRRPSSAESGLTCRSISTSA